MATILEGNTDGEKLSTLIKRTYKEQAVWFLNAFWDSMGKREAENVWHYVFKAEGLDKDHRNFGTALDEFTAHRFLEHFKETLTVTDLRDKLRAIGAIPTQGQVKQVPLTYFFIVKYGVNLHELVTAPQGNREEIEAAQKILNAVQNAFAESEEKDRVAAASVDEATRRDVQARKDEAAAREREAEAKQSAANAAANEEQAKRDEAAAREREAEARAREEEVRAAKEELEAALKELHAQEEAYNARTRELEKASQEGTTMAMSKAKMELAQHLSADPLPLNKAKITQEAAVKKAEKATLAAKEAADRVAAARAEAERSTAQASASRAAAEEAARQASAARASAEDSAKHAASARAQAEKDKEAAAAALAEAKKKVDEAQAFLEEAKKRLPHGGVWWMERELEEARAYLPKAKGGYIKRHMTLERRASRAAAQQAAQQ